MPLEEYRRRRKFAGTPEPSGKRIRRSERRDPIFVVQKHDATRLHYDFRLEIDGVLVSWAVPRGPSLNPRDKRLAILTEDHPLEYAGFEGVIPEQHYGAGPVMIWDRGRYESLAPEPASRQFAAGTLKFVLHGVKLRGQFALVATGRPKQWLLIKHRDEYADTNWTIDDPAVNTSVLTGRTIEEIAAGRPGKRRMAY